MASRYIFHCITNQNKNIFFRWCSCCFCVVVIVPFTISLLSLEWNSYTITSLLSLAEILYRVSFFFFRHSMTSRYIYGTTRPTCELIRRSIKTNCAVYVSFLVPKANVLCFSSCAWWIFFNFNLLLATEWKNEEYKYKRRIKQKQSRSAEIIFAFHCRSFNVIFELFLCEFKFN